ADAGAEDDARTSPLLVREGRRVEAGVPDGLVGGDDGVLAEGVIAASLLAVEVVARLEPLELAGELGRERFGVEVGEGRRAALAAHHGVPEGGDAEADGGERAEAGDDHAAAGERVGHRSYVNSNA